MYVCCVLFLSCALVPIPLHCITSAASRGILLGEGGASRVERKQVGASSGPFDVNSIRNPMANRTGHVNSPSMPSSPASAPRSGNLCSRPACASRRIRRIKGSLGV